jgi:glycosyltransferase involved in cell wall biosynthesis
MKVYFVVKEPSERTINHFVSSLGDALQKQGCEVVYGLNRLWTDEVMDCDIVHFQWPEGIFGLFGHKVTDDELARTEQRLTFLKEQGIKIFVQVHNLKPHTNRDKNVLRLYELLYQQVDVMVHMGNYSRELLQPQYPNAHHIVIPHHIYDNVLSFSVSQQEARQRLRLPADKKIVLSFGKFRNDEERDFVLSLRKNFNSQFSIFNSQFSTVFLMPGFYRQTLHTWNPKKLVPRLYHTLCYRLKGIQFSNEVIPDDMMQYYFCAADVVLIQRLDILNSGNLPMAFHAGKVVVGPDVGNVGQILRETGNFTFNPNNTESAIYALQGALAAISKGDENRAYAVKHWSSGIIAKKLQKCYQEAISTNYKQQNNV